MAVSTLWRSEMGRLVMHGISAYFGGRAEYKNGRTRMVVLKLQPLVDNFPPREILSVDSCRAVEM